MKLPNKILKEIKKKCQKYWWNEKEEKKYNEIEKDLFKLLIFTILSQNTSSTNTWKAFNNLEEKVGVSPYILANADIKDIENAIKSGGLYKIKAKRIKNVAKEIIARWNGSLEWIRKSKEDEIREQLLSIKGIGRKTADVIISSIYGYKNAFVVDTHMFRIAKRLGVVEEKAGYEEVSKALANLFDWENDSNAVSYFWLLAKYICRAKNPRCKECPLKNYCKFGRDK